jgi:hypothetical protein
LTGLDLRPHRTCASDRAHAQPSADVCQATNIGSWARIPSVNGELFRFRAHLSPYSLLTVSFACFFFLFWPVNHIANCMLADCILLIGCLEGEVKRDGGN